MRTYDAIVVQETGWLARDTRLTIKGSFPDTVRQAIVGKRLGDVVQIPLIDLDCIITGCVPGRYQAQDGHGTRYDMEYADIIVDGGLLWKLSRNDDDPSISWE